jgi:hypothetical protein
MDDPTPTVDAPRNPPRRFRRTRIAVSAFFGLLTVMLCVLWVRSYWHLDVAYGWFPIPLYLQLDSCDGDIKLIANQEEQPTDVHYESKPPAPFQRHWNFRIEEHPDYGWWLDVTVPYWCLILVSTAVTAITFQGPMQFSLRALLIATTLVAVVLGLVGYTLR